MINAAVQAVCDRGYAAVPAGTAPGRPRWVLAATILASSLAFIDGSVVNVGLAAIGASFKADAGALQWVINAYLLPLGALLLLGGAAGDRFGRARLVILGTALFGLASAACAMAPNLTWLLTSRFIQGIGAALLMPNSLAVLGAAFSGKARGRAVGIWAAAGSVLGAAGPVLGGWLIDQSGWRAIFLINLPLAVAAILLAWLFLEDASASRNPAPLDISGGFAVTAGLFAITWGLTIGAGPSGWTVPAMALTAAGILLTFGFLWIERTKGGHAMMPLALFASVSFIGLSLLTWFLYGTLGALMVLVPYALIRVADYSGAGAGAALVPFAVILAVASPAMGGLAGKWGARLPLSIGSLVVGAGFLILREWKGDADYWRVIFPAITVIAIGMSGAVAPLTTAVLSSVDKAHTGSASGLNSALARIAGMVATALLGGVLSAKGAALIARFDAAALVCALAALAASASAFFLIRLDGAQD
jgi:EmrB/QacA subfamily drug resistance transporter